MGRGLADGEGRDLSACDATRLGGSAPRRVCLISCNHDAHVGSLYGGHLHARHRNRLDQWAEAERRARRRQGVGSADSTRGAPRSEVQTLRRRPTATGPGARVRYGGGPPPGRAQIKKAKNGIQPHERIRIPRDTSRAGIIILFTKTISAEQITIRFHRASLRPAYTRTAQRPGTAHAQPPTPSCCRLPRRRCRRARSRAASPPQPAAAPRPVPPAACPETLAAPHRGRRAQACG